MRRLHWVTLVLTALAGSTGCEDSTGPATPLIVRQPEAGALAVTPSTAIITVGKSLQLRATVQRSDGSRVAPTGIRWATSDAKVATIGADGSVRGVQSGRVRIDATWRGQHGASYVTVLVPSVGTPCPFKRRPCN